MVAGLSLGFSALLAGCAGEPEVRTRVVVLGMDGLEYEALERYAHDLPNFSRFLAEGAHAEMAVTKPIMSPILWTTMASGYPAEIHGIGGWTSGAGRSFSGADVRVERIWDVLSGAGRKSVLSGWLMTWPAPAIEGAALSDRFVWATPMSRDPNRSVTEEHHDVTAFPDALSARARALLPDDVWLAAHPLAYQIEQYGAPSHPLRRDELHVRVFEALWPESDADFGALYLNGADQVSHLYWPFQDPDVQRAIRKDPSAHKSAVDDILRRHPGRALPPFGETGLTPDRLGDAARWVPDYYRYLDSVLARVRAVVDDGTTLVLVSDHGFQVSLSKPLVDGQHRDTAVFAAVGPGVRKGAEGGLHVNDVAPTVYALLGLPAAEDMPGHAATGLFELTERPPVKSRMLDRAAIEVGAGGSGAGDEALRSQLEALGYLDEDGRPNAAIGGSRSRVRTPPAGSVPPE